MEEPVIAVLGHPNKGKSSIVATLSQDDTVLIGDKPGTTTECRSYPLSVDSKLLYTLVDTPGFQRARSALQWMKTRNPSAAERADVVAAFVHDSNAQQKFPDECELLTPLVNGAGVLYVVDGSVPFGSEYEAEMEILRWSGQPSMALINPIGNELYVEEWRRALNQYFSVVRVFDALKASFEKRTELLRAFCELSKEWQEPLELALEALERNQNRKIEEAAHIVADALLEILTAKKSCRIKTREEVTKVLPSMEKRYLKHLQHIESDMRSHVEAIYSLKKLQREETELKFFENEGLFTERTWKFFGLNPRELMVFGAISGGLAGGVFDTMVGGASFLLGAAIGSGVGAVGALYTAKSMVDTAVLSMPLGEKKLEVGPTKNLNFPHIVFNRARLHHLLVAKRTHAERDILRIVDNPMDVLDKLSESETRSLESCFRKIRKGWFLEGSEKLYKTILKVFLKDLKEPSEA